MPCSRHQAQFSVIARHLLPWVIRSIPIILFSAICATSVRAANNPVPFVDIVSPVSITPGSTSVTLTVRGTGFVSTSTVTWNGTSLTTTFVSARELTAIVPNGFVAAVGLGSVLVVSPTPGGGKSGVTFVPVAATEATTSFPATPTSSVSVGMVPQGLATADFNADGKLDLAVANNGSNTVTILLGNGDGTFTTKSTPAAGNGANWLAVGDFNEDGKLDLAVANLGSTGTGGVSILLGNGDGTFTLKSSPNTGSGPFSLIAGDFNGDGHLDLAVSNQNDGTVTILLGVGDGTFTSGSTLTVGNLPQVIVAGDFNEDGKLDLAVSNESDSTVSILLGIGNGSFQAQSIVAVGGSGSPIGLIAADFNGDGHLDLAAVNASDAAILLGNGSGSFTLKANPTTGSGDLIAGVAGDYNGDHILDIVLSDRSAGKAFLLPGVGDGTFGTKLTFTTSAGAFGVATADFNGDGGLDLAVANGTGNNVSIFLQQLPVSLIPTSLTFGNQLVTTSSSSQAVTLSNTTGGTLTFTSISFTGTESGDFSQTNTCGTSILDNTSCTMHVTFTPTATGARAATLTVVDSGSNSPQTLAVRGTGTAAPSITSANSTSFTIGVAGSFTVTTTGFPAPALSEMASLPSGVTFTDNGDGTATLAGTPAGGTGGSYPLTLTASNGVGSNATQSFTLTVAGASLTIAKAFSPTTIVFNATSSLTVTITNPGTGSTETAVAFTDTLPAGLVVASPNNLSSTCTGTATAVAGSGSANLSGGSLTNLTSCTVSLNVTGVAIGVQNNSVVVSSTPGGTSAAGTAGITVNNANTTTTVTSSANPSVFGQSITFTATVSPVAPGAGTPTGTVTFLDGGSPIGTGTLSGGVATFASSALATGNHTITTSYGGDGNFNGSTGSLTGNPQAVNKANTAGAVTSSANPSGFGQSVTITATVSAVAPGAGTATGTVTFLDGGSPIGTANLSAGVATFTTSALAIGNHTITTSYGGDGNFNGSTGNLTGNPQVVNKADTSTTLTSSTNPSIIGQSVTFTATVSAVAPGAGTVTGTVTFLDGGSPVGTGNLSGGVATFATSSLAAGNHTITTSYGGDVNFNGSTGNLTGNPQLVNKANTTTAVTSSLNPSAFGQSVTFTATVSVVAPGAGTATGTVTFLDGGSAIGTGMLSAGVATFATSALAAGNHTITTSYGGDGSSNGSTGSLTGNPQVVSKANTTSAVTSSLNHSVFGQSVTITATVSAVGPGSGTATGTLTFLDGGSPVGTASLSAGVATFTTFTLAVGNHSITTGYGGDGNFNGSTGNLTGNPQVVNKATTTTALTSSTNPSVFGQSVTFTATDSSVAPGAGTPTGAVTFLDGGSAIGTGTLTAGVATFAFSSLAIGNHTITTSYGGDGNFNGSAGSLTGNPQVVNKANTATTVTSSVNPTVFGQSVTFTVTISAAAPASGTPTGTVTLLDGGSSIGTGILSGGVATFTTAALAIGNHTITTTYPGDGNFNAAAGTLTGNPQVVNKGGSTTTVTSSLNPSALGQSVTFTTTVTATLPAVGTPTGTVMFLDGGTSIGNGTLSGGMATLTTSALAAGNHTITVSYGGDMDFGGGVGLLTGNPQVVVAPPSIAKAFNPTTIVVNATTTLTFTITNPSANTVALAGVAFTDTLPAGLTVASSSGSVCGGTLTATAPRGIALAGAGIAASSQCQFTVTVTGAAAGIYTNTTGSMNSTNGGTGNTAMANVTVATPPSIAKAFGAATIPLNGGTRLTFTTTNPNTTLALTGIAFTDNLPAGLVVGSTPGLTSTCGGTASAVAGSGSASLSAGTLAASASCTVSLNVTGMTAGVMNNSVQVTSTEGGAGNTSSASITVVAPPSIAKAFGAPNVFVSGSNSLTFTITNSNTTVALAGVAFADALPSGLQISTPNGISGSCGAGAIVAAAGSSSISLTGGSVPASGTCVFSVNVTATGSGIQFNTTDSVTSANGGTGNRATAQVMILVPDLTIAKVHAGIFSQGDIGDTYRITVTNSGAAPTVAQVSVVDTLPSDLTATAMSGTGWVCTLATLTCTRSDVLNIGQSYSLIALTVNVSDTAATRVVNTVTVSGGGEVNTANDTATDTAPVTQVADLTISKSHSGNFRQGQAGAIYTLTAMNVGNGPTVGVVTVTDTLPAGLTATALSGTGWACNSATLTCTRSDALASAGTYPAITLTVTVAANASGTLTNLAAISGGGELNLANDSASDPTTIVLVADLTITKSHTGNFYQGESGVTYLITVGNAGPGPTVGTVNVADTLPAGLTATDMSGTGWTCDAGTLRCNRSDVLAINSSYPPITLTTSVALNAAASLVNTVMVSGGGEINFANDTAMDTTVVTPPPDFTISLSPPTSTVVAGNSASYTIFLTDLNAPFVNPVTLSATGLPPKASLVFMSNSLTPGATSATSTLLIATAPGDPYIANLPGKHPWGAQAALLPLIGLAIAGLGLRKGAVKKRRPGWPLFGLAFLFCGLAVYGCTGVKSNFQYLGTSPGVYTITVTGTSGTVQHSTTVTLTVNP